MVKTIFVCASFITNARTLAKLCYTTIIQTIRGTESIKQEMRALRNCKIKFSLCFLLRYIPLHKIYFSFFQLCHFLLSSQPLILVLIWKKIQGVQDSK